MYRLKTTTLAETISNPYSEIHFTPLSMFQQQDMLWQFTFTCIFIVQLVNQALHLIPTRSCGHVAGEFVREILPRFEK